MSEQEDLYRELVTPEQTIDRICEVLERQWKEAGADLHKKIDISPAMQVVIRALDYWRGGEFPARSPRYLGLLYWTLTGEDDQPPVMALLAACLARVYRAEEASFVHATTKQQYARLATSWERETIRQILRFATLVDSSENPSQRAN